MTAPLSRAVRHWRHAIKAAIAPIARVVTNCNACIQIIRFSEGLDYASPEKRPA